MKEIAFLKRLKNPNIDEKKKKEREKGCSLMLLSCTREKESVGELSCTPWGAFAQPLRSERWLLAEKLAIVLPNKEELLILIDFCGSVAAMGNFRVSLRGKQKKGG